VQPSAANVGATPAAGTRRRAEQRTHNRSPVDRRSQGAGMRRFKSRDGNRRALGAQWPEDTFPARRSPSLEPWRPQRGPLGGMQRPALAPGSGMQASGDTVGLSGIV
jgi:hypothetical protein